MSEYPGISPEGLREAGEVSREGVGDLQTTVESVEESPTTDEGVAPIGEVLPASVEEVSDAEQIINGVRKEGIQDNHGPEGGKDNLSSKGRAELVEEIRTNVYFDTLGEMDKADLESLRNQFRHVDIFKRFVDAGLTLEDCQEQVRWLEGDRDIFIEDRVKETGNF